MDQSDASQAEAEADGALLQTSEFRWSWQAELARTYDHVRRGLIEDWPLHAVAGGYLLAALVLAVLLDAPERLVPFMYLWFWAMGLAAIVLLYLLLVEVPPRVWAGSRQPLTDALVRAHGKFGSRFVPGLMLLASMGVFYGTFTSIKNMLPLLTTFWADRPLAEWDALLHGGRDPWQLLHPILGYPEVTRVIEFAYSSCWALLLIGLPTVLALHPRLAHLRLRYFVSMFVCFVVLGNIVAGLGMSAGPVYYGHMTGDHDRFAGLVQYLSFSEGLLHSASDIQRYLWEAYRTGQVQTGAGISAFPSMHLAMATLYVLLAWNIDRRFGVALAVFACVILMGSVHLGWHYAIDGYVSIAVALTVWVLAGRLQPLSLRPAFHRPALAEA